MGLLDYDYSDPRMQGLLGMGLSMLQNSGPSDTPRSLAQVVGAGGMQGLGMYGQAKQFQAEQKYRDLQTQQLQSAVEQTKAFKEALNNPGASPIAGTKEADPIANAYMKSGDVAGYLNYLKTQKELRPKFGNTFQAGIGPDGQLHNYQVADDGSVRDSGLGVKPEIASVDTGGTQVFYDKNRTLPGSAITKTQTPDSVAVNGPGGQFGGGSSLEQLVEGIGTGKIAPPSGLALRNPRVVALMNQVLEKYPDYDGTVYATRQSAQKSWAPGGKSGDSYRSIGTANKHLDMVNGLVDALNNKDIQLLNKLGNEYTKQTGNPAPTNFDAAKNIVGQEVVKAIVANGGGVAEREEAGKLLDKAQSPAQLKGVINTYKTIMSAQKESLLQQRRAAGLPDKTLPDYTEGAGGGTPGAKVPVKTGLYGGKKVIQYSDGSIEYAN